MTSYPVRGFGAFNGETEEAPTFNPGSPFF